MHWPAGRLDFTSSGSNVSQRRFGPLQLEFVFSANVATSLPETSLFRALLGYLDRTVRRYVISRCTLVRTMHTVQNKKQKDVIFVLPRHDQLNIGRSDVMLASGLPCNERAFC
jgi:hypothetical protein